MDLKDDAGQREGAARRRTSDPANDALALDMLEEFNTATAAVTHVVTAGQRLKANVNVTGGTIFSVECSVVGDLLAP